MEGQKALELNLKYLKLCSKDELAGLVGTFNRHFWVNYPYNIKLNKTSNRNVAYLSEIK